MTAYGALLLPAAGFTRVSSPFGAVRGSSRHNGTDWPMPEGTPLRAMSDGVVSFRLFPPDDSGNAIGVDADDGRTSWSYSHMSRVDVRPGQRVRRGEVLGLSGFTGHVIPAGPQGAHVHVVTRVDGQLVDPAKGLGSPIVRVVIGAALVAGVVVVAVPSTRARASSLLRSGIGRLRG